LILQKIHEKVLIGNSLSAELNSFSHKRPYAGGPTKATAYLTVSSVAMAEEIMLSVYGIQGKSEPEDLLSDAERYDLSIWRNYKISLKSFNYDSSIEIIVYENK